LRKLSASEILTGLRVTTSERQHAQRAIAAAKKSKTAATASDDLRGKTSELRVRHRSSRKGLKAKSKV
jgi:hypothetical protein